MPPTLESPRLILRPHRPDDFPASATLWADPIVTRHIGGRPLSEEEAWTKFLRYFGHWTCLGFGYWVVEERSSGAFVGEVGFADYKRNLESSAKGLPEMGWVLSPAFHGKGYATEAVSTALDWANGRFPRVSCIIHPENTASTRVAQKCGFVELERTLYNGRETIVFTR